MTDNEHSSFRKAGELDRRSMLVGGAATAAAASLPSVAIAGSGGSVGILSAVYMDPTYLKTFRDQQTGWYSKNHVADVRAIIRKNFATRDALKWGDYQQKVEPNPANWGGTSAFNNWPIFVQEAREDLAKLPAPSSSDPHYAMNPSNTSLVASNMLEHLDECVRIALWDNQAVSLYIDVGKNKRRHHKFTTKWDLNGNQPDKLTINVDCPDGGWQGYTIWPFKAPSAHVTTLKASWKVPPAPVNNTGSQIIFIFSGIESSSSKTVPGGILQPVLQWTNTGWAVRSWYVRSDFDPVANPNVPAWTMSKPQSQIDTGDTGRCYSEAAQVQPNQTITGSIAGGIVGGKFNYTCSIAVDGVNQTKAALSVTDIPELSFPVCAVESYGIRDDTTAHTDEDYPAGVISMTGIDLQIDGGSVNNIQWRDSQRKGGDYNSTSSNAGKKIDFKRT